MLAAVRDQQHFRLAAFGFPQLRVGEMLTNCVGGGGFADEDVVLAGLLRPLLERRHKRVAEVQTDDEAAAIEAARGLYSPDELEELWTDELEALQSIFEDDFSKLSRLKPCWASRFPIIFWLSKLNRCVIVYFLLFFTM